MTAVDDIRGLGELLASTERAFQDEKRAHGDTIVDLGYALERAERAETRLQELEADVEASTAVDLLKRYRRVCAENQAMRGQLELWLRGHPMTVERRAMVSSLVNGAAATARAQAEALKGNR